MIAGCGSQLRIAGLGTPFALDFGTVLKFGEARGADIEMLADLLPAAERAVIAAIADGGDQGGGEDGQ